MSSLPRASLASWIAAAGCRSLFLAFFGLLAAIWGSIATAAIFQLAMGLVFIKLPAELVARVMFLAAEEERRLRRGLHDGLGPQRASQTLTLAAARQLLRRRPGGGTRVLASLPIG